MESTGRSERGKAVSRRPIPTREGPLELGKEEREATIRDGRETAVGRVEAEAPIEVMDIRGRQIATEAGGEVPGGTVGTERG